MLNEGWKIANEQMKGNAITETSIDTSQMIRNEEFFNKKFALNFQT